jgi:RimJ/RimL family protein N-acetyltransferase
VATRVFEGGNKVSSWAVKKLNDADVKSVADLGEHIAFGITVDGKAVAACIFNNYRPMAHGADLRVIIVSTDPNWCRKGILKTLFGYAFDTAKCSRLTAVIREGNEASVKLCAGLGFRKEGVLRKGYNGKTNALIFGMLRHECKWIEAHNGQKGRKHPSASSGVSDNLGAAGG